MAAFGESDFRVLSTINTYAPRGTTAKMLVLRRHRESPVLTAGEFLGKGQAGWLSYITDFVEEAKVDSASDRA
jgi:hypothetical protein